MDLFPDKQSHTALAVGAKSKHGLICEGGLDTARKDADVLLLEELLALK